MSKKQKKTNKLAVIIITSLLLIISISLVVWAVYSRNHSSSNDDSASTSTADTASSVASSSADSSQAETTTTPTVQTDPNEGYVTIDEWGVRFKPVEGLLSAVYFKSNYSEAGGEYYDFIVKELADIEPNCAENGFSSIFRTSEPTDTHGSLLATINGYYYYSGSGAACSYDSANSDFEMQQRNLLKESQESLEAME